MAALIIEVAWRLVHASPATTGDTLNFLSLLGFWNSFVLLYFDWRRTRLGRLTAESRIRSLESQIRPHFFFNTLTTISAFIPEQPEAAQAILLRLAGLFRKTISNAESAVVPLSQELEVTREYLEIEKARFGSRIRYTLPESRQTDGLSILTLTVQPLVENAVRHGIARLPEGGEVRVDIVRDADFYQLRVSSPVEDFRDIQLDRLLQEGHSLRLIADRLRLFYRGKAKMEAQVDTGFLMIMKIPKDGRCAR